MMNCSFQGFGCLEATVVLQLIFEMIPLSSTAQTKLFQYLLIKWGWVREAVCAVGVEILHLSNLVSDVVVFAYFSQEFCENLWPKKGSKKVFSMSIYDFAFSELWDRLTSFDREFAHHCLRLLVLAGLGNIATVGLYYFVCNTGCLKGLTLGIPVNMMVVYAQVASALIVASNFFVRKYVSKASSAVTLQRAVAIGFAQGLTLVRGVSRLGVTYTVGRWMGLAERSSLIFSFLMHAQISIAYFTKTMMNEASRAAVWQAASSIQCYGGLLLVVGTVASYYLFSQTYRLATDKKFYLFAPLYLISIYLLISNGG